jgi:endo-1,4-beta-xylanase
MHINVLNPPLEEIRATLTRFGADARLVNQITEMDVSVYTNSTDTAPVPEETLVRQGYRYRDVFDLYRELAAVIESVTIWGLGDDTTWLTSFPIARPDQPLLFDRNLQAKHAYWGVVDPSRLPIIPQRLGVANGSIHVDGRIDPAWDFLPPVSLGANGTLSASFKALWDADTVYLLVEVLDGSREAGDLLDVFIDGSKYTLAALGRERGGLNAMVLPTSGGYRVEAAVPAGQMLSTGQELRFDLRVTDGATGDRLSWSDTHHDQETSPDTLGFLTLNGPTQQATVPRGSPVVDGLEEHAWKHAIELTSDRVVLGGTSGASATVKVLWDSGHLYVFAKVADPLLSKASSNPWEEDSVEIFVDQNNARTTSYQGDDMQFRVNFDNEQSFGGAAGASKFVTATRIVDGGYHVEAAIAMDVVLQAGSVVGLDFQVNDDGQGDGVRSSVRTWNDPTGTAFLDTSQFGTLKLVVAGQTQ